MFFLWSDLEVRGRLQLRSGGGCVPQHRDYLSPQGRALNLVQFFMRWPKTEGRLFFFAGGKDHDRLTAYYTVADYWRRKVDRLDFVRLRDVNMMQTVEACLQDPVVGPKRVVAVTEMIWEDPDETDDVKIREKRKRQFDAMARFLDSFPRDVVLIMSCPHDNPLTKNAVAQPLIRKGYWVVLRHTDTENAVNLIKHWTKWDDEELILEVVDSVGTSVADLFAFLRLVRVVNKDPTPQQIRDYLTTYVRAGVFEIVDSIIMRDLETSLHLAQSDIPLGQVVGAFDRKLTSLIQFMAEMKRGRTPKEAAVMLRMPGFVVHGLYEASKRWRTADLLQLYPKLSEYSLYGDRPGALDMFIHEVIGER